MINMGFEKIKISNTNYNLKEFSRYVIASIGVFFLDLGLLFMLTEIFNFFYLISGLISISIAFSINYFLNIKWVFNDRKYIHKPFFEYFLMISISIMVSGFNVLGMWLFTEFLNVYYVLSKIIISLITFIIKFILRKNILFNF